MRELLFKKNRIWLPLAVIAVAAICCLLGMTPNRPEPAGNWQEKSVKVYENISADLKKKRLELTDEGGKLLWESPGEHQIQDVLCTDLDGDGEKELILLLWKIGRYGKHRPFWIEEDEKSFSQHVFIYSVSSDGTLRHRWGASEVGREIVRMKLMDKNQSFLLTEDAAGDCAVWRWESFGIKTIDSSVSFVAFGDNIIHDQIIEKAGRSHGGSFDFLYEPFYKDIQAADIAAMQQESILVDSPQAVSGYPYFGSPIEVGEAITKAGFDVVSCAGNHALDKGVTGIDVTMDFYAENGVRCIGVQSSDDSENRPFETVSKNGISFALLDYTYGVGVSGPLESYPFAVHLLPRNDSQEKELVDDIKKAKEASDFVIVFVHWGNEYDTEISKEQKDVAALFAEGGADVVIGTHSHVLQDMELVKRPDGGDMLVYYSLGNFRAFQGQTDETKRGGKALFTVEHCYDGVRLKDYSLETIDAYVYTGD